MGTALAPYVMLECDTCNGAITDAPFLVLGTPERFCSLVCCKIFYTRTTGWISTHRKEKNHAAV